MLSKAEAEVSLCMISNANLFQFLAFLLRLIAANVVDKTDLANNIVKFLRLFMWMDKLAVWVCALRPEIADESLSQNIEVLNV